MKKKAYNEDSLRKRVYAFLDMHPNDTKNFIVNHFRMANIPKSAIYNILKRKGEQYRTRKKSRKWLQSNKDACKRDKAP